MTRLALLLSLCLAALAGCGHHVRCPQGESVCGGHCVSLLTDAANCGSCGNAASPLQVCQAGALACAPGVGVCGGACIDLARDPAHCGACDSACGAGTLCSTDAGGSSSCVASCPEGTTACAGACVALDSDRLDCGACGHACSGGQTCHAGACGADLAVACLATSDVRPVTADLQPAGPARLAQGSPTVLEASQAGFFSGNGFPAGVTIFPLDDRLPGHLTALSGDDIEGIAAYAGTALVANDSANTLAIVAGDGRVLDEVSLLDASRPGDDPKPHGIAVAGTTAYVALYGDGPNGFNGHPQTTGQAIARVDLSTLQACLAGTASGCASLAGFVDLLGVAGAFDTGGYPFPVKLAVRGTKVYAVLANLLLADCGFSSGYCKPAGNGKLAVIDTAAGDAVTIVDLGAECKNPGDIDIDGDTAWVTCGSFSFRADAPGAVVPVDLSGRTPAVRPKVDASAIVPGALAICGGMGYVTDQSSGDVVRFDPATGQVEAPVTVCPLSGSFALAADIACPRP